jgi:hypothetical protein
MEKTSMYLFSDNIMKEDGVETLESNPTSSQKGFLRLQRQYPNPWNHFMPGFESPILPAPKRKSGWLVSFICLVLLLATTQYYNPRNVRAIPSRLFGFDYASRVVELSSDSNTIGLSGLARTNQVQFDNYSLILQGQRIFLQYGIIILSVFSILPPSAPENFTHSGCLFRRSGQTF